jgi:hypothetical protein
LKQQLVSEVEAEADEDFKEAEAAEDCDEAEADEEAECHDTTLRRLTRHPSLPTPDATQRTFVRR